MTKEELLQAAKKVLKPLKDWSKNCHAASITLVRAGCGTRVARGFCEGVASQHSWVVVGDDCYDKKALIIDPTLWSYRDDVKGIFVGNQQTYNHKPHGSGSIWNFGKPINKGGETILLKYRLKLSSDAKTFLELVEPLDYAGWLTLGSAPVGGWPAAEIYKAMYETPALWCAVPIDKIGMLTNINPSKLYLP